mmetsp:Transcript_7924/g.11754  ORF Transcript_7924/g.11754 Transcript_7924/m.11754 type:complete len:271 (+) Transcript_7924:43-855(+)
MVFNTVWTALNNNFEEKTVQLYIPLGTIIVGNIVPSFILGLCEVNGWVPEFLKKKKLQSKKEVTYEQLFKALKLLITHYLLIVIPLYALLFTQLTSTLGFSAGEVPPMHVCLLQIGIFMVIEDFCQYWGHRWLHHRKVYKSVHSVHHEYSAPFALTGQYAHWLEVIILGTCTFVGPLLFRPHLLVFFSWVHVKQIMTQHSHSGYEIGLFPILQKFIPFLADVEYHDYHHRTINGPYGTVFTCWDSFFGTDIEYRKHHATLKREKEQQKNE